MAHALVVYESMFGNTEAIAQEVARGLSTHMQVSIREVGQAAHAVPDDVALVVVGAPTHALGLSRASSREDAGTKRDQPLVSQGDGLREWLASARPGRAGTLAAAFDTRSAHPRLPGSAARAAARRLRRRGFALAGPTRSFWVDGMTGPLAVGELERARAWGAQLGATIAGAEQAPVVAA